MYSVQAITDFNQQNDTEFIQFKIKRIYARTIKMISEVEESDSDPEEQWMEIEEKSTYQVQNHHVHSHSGTQVELSVNAYRCITQNVYLLHDCIDVKGVCKSQSLIVSHLLCDVYEFCLKIWKGGQLSCEGHMRKTVVAF